MTIRKQIDKMLKEQGFFVVRTSGSHRVFRSLDGLQISVSCSPSDQNAVDHIYKDILRLRRQRAAKGITS